MGYSYYIENGRECGYSISATCDHEGCGIPINRGVSYKCEDGCGGFFCTLHKVLTLCDECEEVLTKEKA